MKKDSNNKKLYYIGGIVAVIIIVIIILLLTSCNKGYKIELTVDNDLFYQANIHKGDTLEGVKVPTKEGYTFEGWYLDGEKFDITTPIEEDLKLEARFTKNKYTVTFEYDNGKENSKLEVEYGSTIKEPKKPTRKGYTFAGWYVGEKEYDFTSKVINNINIVAKWNKNGETTTEKNELTSYTVEHYLMGLDGKYTEVNEKEILNGKIGSTVSPSVKSYPGFTSPSVEKAQILADGKLVVKYYYARNKYTLTVNGDKGVSNTTGTGEYYYGETVKVGYSLNAGYTFNNYSEELENDSFVMGAENKTINVLTIANENTPYTVEHYLMDIDGEHYTLKDTDKLTGTTDSKVTPEVKDYTGFSAPQKEEVTVLGDGKLVVKYYYGRNKYTLKVTGDKGVSSTIGSGEYYYEEKVNVEVALKPGYEFTNWSNEETTNKITVTIGAEDIELKASTKTIEYGITYKLNDGEVTENLPESYTVEDKIEIEKPTKAGYSFDYFTVNGEKIDGNVIEANTITGDIEIEAFYKANEDTPYTVLHVFMDTEGNYANVQNVSDCTEANLCKIEKHEGTTDSTVDAPLLENIEAGFTSPEELKQVTIKADGSAVVIYNYSRNRYTLTVTGDKGVSSTVGGGEYYYEEVVENISYTLNEGYEFVKYSEELDNNSYKMGAESKEITITTKPIEYEITYDLQDGETCKDCASLKSYTVEEDVTLPEATKEGYTFNGWLVNGGKEPIKSFVKGTYHEELSLIADFTANEDTPYKVVYHIMDTDGKYTIENEESYKGTTDTKIVYTPNIAKYVTDVKGFDTPVLKENETGSELSLDNIVISGKGNTVLNYYVARKQFELTIEKKTGILSTTGEGPHYYEEKVPVTAQLSEGYENITWNPSLGEDNTYTMKASENKLEVSASPMSITYNVLHLKSNKENNIIDDNIDTVDKCTISDLCEVEEKTALYDSEAIITSKNYDGFTAAIPSDVIVKNNLIVIVKYTRNEYELTVNLDKGINKLTINTEEKNIEGNKYTEKYYFEQPIDITVEPKAGYHVTNNSTINTEMELNGKTVSFTSAANKFKIKYHNEDGTEELSEEYTYNDNLTIELPKRDDKTYTLTIKENKVIPTTTPTLTFVNEFSGWSKNNDNSSLDYEKDKKAAIIPIKDGEVIDLYVYYKKQERDISELQTGGYPFYNGDRFYFNGYIDGDTKIKKDQFKKYTIDEDKTLTCWWLDIISLETFDKLVMANADKNTFSSHVINDNKVVGFIKGAKSLKSSWVITTLHLKLISPTINLLANDDRINKIIIDNNGSQAIIDDKVFSNQNPVLALFKPNIVDADNHDLKITVELNPDLAISKSETSSIEYTLNVQALVDESEMETLTTTGNSVLGIFDNNGKLPTDRTNLDTNGEIVFMYDDPDSSLSSSPLLFSGWTTAIDKLFENPFVDSIDITFMNTLGSSYSSYLVSGQKNTYRLNYTNRSSLAFMLSSDTSAFGKKVSDLYKDGNSDTRYKLKVKLNLSGGNIVDFADGYSSSLRTDYTILFGPKNN